MKPKIDLITFTCAIAVLLGVSIPLGFMPEQSGPFVTGLYNDITENFGILYQLAAIGTIIVLGYIAFGRYGNVRLGDQNGKPEFSTFSWVAMLFCAGVGAGLIYWAGIEWGYYYEAPPFGIEPESVAAAEYAAAYGAFLCVRFAGYRRCAPRREYLLAVIAGPAVHRRCPAGVPAGFSGCRWTGP